MIQQLSVFLENRAGQLAQITQILSQHQIDLRAINIAETADYGVLRLIAADTRKAAAVLSEEGFVLSVTPVAVVAVPDRPGGLNELLTILSDRQVDIEYMYSVFGKTNGLAYMVFRVSDADAFENTLKEAGLQSADAAELGL